MTDVPPVDLPPPDIELEPGVDVDGPSDDDQDGAAEPSARGV